jgi:hypothetical protein
MINEKEGKRLGELNIKVLRNAGSPLGLVLCSKQNGGLS